MASPAFDLKESNQRTGLSSRRTCASYALSPIFMVTAMLAITATLSPRFMSTASAAAHADVTPAQLERDEKQQQPSSH
jgi:hypothetical protein